MRQRSYSDDPTSPKKGIKMVTQRTFSSSKIMEIAAGVFLIGVMAGLQLSPQGGLPLDSGEGYIAIGLVIALICGLLYAGLRRSDK